MYITKLNENSNSITLDSETLKEIKKAKEQEGSIQAQINRILQLCDFIYSTLLKAQEKIISNGNRLIIGDKQNPELKSYMDLLKSYMSVIRDLNEVINAIK